MGNAGGRNGKSSEINGKDWQKKCENLGMDYLKNRKELQITGNTGKTKKIAENWK